MILYTLIFLSVTYVFAYVGIHYYKKYETVNKLQQSMNALNAVYNYYALKQTELPDIILPFYQKNDNAFSIEDMLRSPTDEYYNDPVNKMEMYDVLEAIADRDGDIKEILLYKDINETRYVYRRKDQTIEEVNPDYAFFDMIAGQNSGRIITGTQTTGNSGKVNSEAVYGIGGVIGADKAAGVAGKFLILFNTEAIKSLFQSYGETYGRFVIITLAGDIIYDSEGSYDGEKFLYIDELISEKDSFVIDGQKFYVQKVKNSKANVVGANIVPESALKNTSFTMAVYGIITLMAFVCAALYMLGGYFISRRVKEIELAMHHAGSSNLSYRIPIKKRFDEFESIAVKFNEMCDRLQATIESEYISEIKKKNAELRSLQTGINPHFLYNTLEAISVSAIDAGNKDGAKMIVNLANLYRTIVNGSTFIPLRSEINICDMYMDIFLMRYGNFVDYQMEFDPQILAYCIPKNLLQPIIENYFVHGIKESSYDNYFEIKGFMKDGDICFVFEDNGRGISKAKIDEIKRTFDEDIPEKISEYGLLNIQQRIRLIYGRPYGITVESREGAMTRITVLIRAMTCEELEANFKSVR